MWKTHVKWEDTDIKTAPYERTTFLTFKPNSFLRVILPKRASAEITQSLMKRFGGRCVFRVNFLKQTPYPLIELELLDWNERVRLSAFVIHGHAAAPQWASLPRRYFYIHYLKSIYTTYTTQHIPISIKPVKSANKNVTGIMFLNVCYVETNNNKMFICMAWHELTVTVHL